MKVAKLNSIEDLDHLYIGGEPEWKKENRSIIVVSDDYDFVSNNATDITTPELLIKYELDFIKRRKDDGINAYQTKQAELRLARISNGIDYKLWHDNIYVPLAYMISSVESGNWLDAYEDLKNVSTNAIFTQEMKTSFLVEIANYLCFSGNYMEFKGNTVDSNGNII